MKRFFTISSGLLLSVASFAAFSPNRLTVSTETNNIIKVTVDESRFVQQSTGSSIVFEDMQPGFHTVNVYQVNDRNYGISSRRRGDDYRLVYTASINIKPLFATTITLNRFGRVQVIEQPVRGKYDDSRWDKDRRADRRSDNGGYRNDPSGRNEGYGRNDSYYHTISDADFFAAERVMDRENDNGRLLYAKQLVDDNYLDAQQVKELARFFSFDNCRFDFVKYAYAKTTDRNNFSVVCAAFSSNDGRVQVQDFIRNCK